MSFNLDNDSKKLMEQINNLIDEKLEKLKKDQDKASAIAKQEISTSIEKLLSELTFEEIKSGGDIWNLSEDAMMHKHPFLSQAHATQMKKWQNNFSNDIIKHGLNKPKANLIWFYYGENKKGFSLFTSIYLDGNLNSHHPFTASEKHEFQDYLAFILPIYLDQNIQLNKFTMDIVLNAQPKVKRISFLIDGFGQESVLLSTSDFLELCSKATSLKVYAQQYPRNFLNDEFMIEIIKLDHLTLDVINHCPVDTWETSLTDKTLCALVEGETVKEQFIIAHYYNSFTVKRIRKLIQKCVKCKVEKLDWELGTLKKEQKPAADRLMHEINQNTGLPYRIYNRVSNGCCDGGHDSFVLVKRECQTANYDEYGNDGMKIRFLVRKT